MFHLVSALLLSAHLAQGARTAVQLVDDGGGGVFRCPSECSSCCAASNKHLKLFGTSGTSFKCVLKNGYAPPLGRICEHAKPRNTWLNGYPYGQGDQPKADNDKYKIRCKFYEQEIHAAAWTTLGKCAYRRNSPRYTYPHPSELVTDTFDTKHGSYSAAVGKDNSYYWGEIQKSGGDWVPREVAHGLRNSAYGHVFHCPDECVECCAAHAHKTFLKHFGTSQSHFKCTLKSSAVLPRDRTCKAPRRRSRTGWWWGDADIDRKAECEFTEMEKSASVWKDLGKCSWRYDCCCSGSEFWSAEICMPLGTPERIWMNSSRTSSEELFVRTHDQTYSNKFGRCKSPKLGDGKWFQTPGYCRCEGSCFMPVPGYSRNCHGNCCVNTHTEERCSSCSDGDGGSRQCCHTVTVCDAWEQLYRCSDDGGLTQSGLLYRRTSVMPGTCTGDETTYGELFRLNAAVDEASVRAIRAVGGSRKEEGRSSGVCPQGSWSIGQDERPCQCASDFGFCRTGRDRHRQE